MEIGRLIRDVLREKNHSASWLARQICCDRTNVYNIFRRTDIDMKLLARISRALDHDFFADLSARLTGRGADETRQQ